MNRTASYFCSDYKCDSANATAV